MRRPADSDPPIDWTLTTWEGSRREQLRRWAALPLDRTIAALEEMANLARAFQRADQALPRPEGGSAGPAVPIAPSETAAGSES